MIIIPEKFKKVRQMPYFNISVTHNFSKIVDKIGKWLTKNLTNQLDDSVS